MNYIRQQQRHLAMLGLYRSTIDGLDGPHTQEAAREFRELERIEAKEWEHALLEKIRSMNPGDYLTPEIQMLLDDNPRPQDWSAGVRQEFRDHAKRYFLPALLELTRFLYLPMVEQVAYMMATVEHETMGTYLPVREAFHVGEKARRNYLSKMKYGIRWSARGHVGLTWEYNYLKYSNILGIDLVAEPDLALDPDLSIFILVHGMKTGTYTARSLEQYINPHHVDLVNARRVVNGTDKAEAIAQKAQLWIQEIKAL